MSRYVERDSVSGKLKGSFARLQPGYAEEELPDGHPDLVEFDTRRPLGPSKDIVDQIIELPPARKAALKVELAKP